MADQFANQSTGLLANQSNTTPTFTSIMGEVLTLTNKRSHPQINEMIKYFHQEVIKSADRAGIEANIYISNKCDSPAVQEAIKNIKYDGFEVASTDCGICSCTVNVSWKNAY
jgi:hypothetical protein